MNTQPHNLRIRPIGPDDNAALATIVRTTLQEFGAARAGTVYYDDTTDNLYTLFQTEGSAYFVALDNGTVAGGGGIYPTEGLPPGTCELVKMYLAKAYRGRGLGRAFITQSLEAARNLGYKQVYLETMPELQQALSTYAKFGFEYLDGPMGNSGHHGCTLWMLLRL